MVYIKNKGIQMATDIPGEYRDEIKAIVKGKGEGEISEDALKYILTGAEVITQEPMIKAEPVIKEDPVVEEEAEFNPKNLDEGVVEEQPKPKNKKKNKIELA